MKAKTSKGGWVGEVVPGSAADKAGLKSGDIITHLNGRQIDSFETDIKFKGITEPKIRAVFIRAPWVESVGSEVEVLAEVTDPDGVNHPVAVRQGNLLATSFHPELTGDNRVHRYFVENICNQLATF